MVMLPKMTSIMNESVRLLNTSLCTNARNALLEGRVISCKDGSGVVDF